MVFTAFVGLVTLLIAVLVLAIGLNRLAPLAMSRWLRNTLRRLAGLQAKTIHVQGLNVPYLVLVHGFTADKDTWGAVARHLTGKYRVIAPDLPGFGDATRDPTANYSLDAQVENLRAFLHSMGLRRVHLGVSSMGGGIVALYAAKYPLEVASLWLLAAAATGEVSRSDLMKHYDATSEFPLLVQTQAQQLANFRNHAR